jgi:general secretion pathway protein H
MMNTCPSRRRCEAGFTLIELLVVLGIGAIVLASLQLFSGRKAVGLDVVAAQVATSLRSARESAVAFGQPVVMRIANDGSRFQFSTARASVPLPRGVRISYQGIAGFNRAGLGDELTFFIDGTSTGGRLLVTNGRAVTSLAIAPLSGAVRVEAAP